MREPEPPARSPTPEHGPDAGDHDLFGATAAKKEKEPCPYDKLAELFAEYCPELVQPVRPSTKWPATRRKRFQTLWDDNPSLEFWRQFFRTVGESDFLCGRTGKNWKAAFDWVVVSANFTKINEGNYSNSTQKGNMFESGRFSVGNYGPSETHTAASWLNDLEDANEKQT